MIIKLDTSHSEDIRRILTSNKKHQGVYDFTFANKVADAHIKSLSNPNANVFGYLNDDNKVVAFIATKFWNDKENVTFSTSSVDQNENHPLSDGSRWPHAIIALVNYGVFYYQKQGVKYLWTIRPNSPNWVPYTNAKECVLRNFNFEAVCTVPANVNFPLEYQEVCALPLPMEQIIIKYMLQ